MISHLSINRCESQMCVQYTDGAILSPYASFYHKTGGIYQYCDIV